MNYLKIFKNRNNEVYTNKKIKKARKLKKKQRKNMKWQLE